MAKNPKKEDHPTGMGPGVSSAHDDSFNDRIVAEVDKEYGKGLICSGEDVACEKKVIVPISPSLDIITSGGIREGSWVGITGPEKLGKTVLALTIAANAQRPEFGNRIVYYAAVEARITPMHLRGIRGLDLSPDKFKVIRSMKGQVLTSEKWLDIFTRILRTVPGCVLIIDSISTLCEEAVMTGGVGTQTRSAGYKYVTQFVETMAPVVPINNNIVIGITRMIANTSGMGAGGRQEKAANSWKYQCDYQLRGIMKQAWKAGARQIGQVVTWGCNCSALGPPGMKIESYLRYGTGFDRLFEALTFGQTVGLVKKAGSWLTLDFLGRPEYVHLLGTNDLPKTQGGEAMYQILLQRPDWAAALEAEVVKAAGSLTTGGDED